MTWRKLTSPRSKKIFRGLFRWIRFGLVSGLVLLVSLEIAARLFQAYLWYSPRWQLGYGGYSILTLGESTTADHVDLTSWPQILSKKLSPSTGSSKIQIRNEGVAGTNTSVMAEKLPRLLDQIRPDLVITMMGTNDQQTFWFNQFGLISDESLLSHFKSIKILRYFWNRQRIDQLAQQPREPLLEPQFFNFEDPHKNLAALKNQPPGTPDYQAAERLVETFLASKTNEIKAMFYAELSMFTKPAWGEPPEKFASSYAFAKKALTFSPYVKNNLTSLVLLAPKMGEPTEQCQRYYDFAKLHNLVIDHILLGRLVTCFRGDTEAAQRIVSQESQSFSLKEPGEWPTAENYDYFFKVLSERKICWIAMEYPRREVSTYLRKLNDSKNPLVFTLENKARFEEALKEKGWDEIFRDNFAGVFGHTTELGSTLIAENVLAFLQELKRKKLCGLENISGI